MDAADVSALQTDPLNISAACQTGRVSRRTLATVSCELVVPSFVRERRKLTRLGHPRVSFDNLTAEQRLSTLPLFPERREKRPFLVSSDFRGFHEAQTPVLPAWKPSRGLVPQSPSPASGQRTAAKDLATNRIWQCLVWGNPPRPCLCIRSESPVSWAALRHRKGRTKVRSGPDGTRSYARSSQSGLAVSTVVVEAGL